MAPIPRLAYKPLSILTGALLGAIGGPSSTPSPADGKNATVWGTEYFGMASVVDIRLVAANSTESVELSTNTTTPTPSPTHIYYQADENNFSACNGTVVFNNTDNVVLLNTLQFGNLTDTVAKNSTCGQWIDITSRANTAQTIKAQIVGACDECEYGSIAAPVHVLDGLAPELNLKKLTFDNSTTAVNIANATDATKPVSSKNVLPISWQLTKGPGQEDEEDTTDPENPSATPSPTKTKTQPPKPEPTKPAPPPPEPKPVAKKYTGRGTWFSDTSGQCEHEFSQSDMIVAVNEAQMGKGKNLCGRKIAVKRKGYSETVVVKVVDMCPSRYCDFGDLDISKGAFAKLAELKVGVLELEWNFVDDE
ncbi:hypothetical protein DFQ26_002310 [Actinomortierella ambigua]|nr:hypothetical protein DFQ26_002310 [Actinomortierella ambigua]